MIDDKNSENEPKVIKKISGKIIDALSKNYSQTIEQSKIFGNESLEKITEESTAGIDYLKSKPYWESLKNTSVKIKEKSAEHGVEFKKNGSTLYKKICSGFFNFFELLVGRIKLGIQYGVPSLELLEKLAKLHELGILTDEEFTNKKKKILERI